MLPDLPNLKHDIELVLTKYLRAQVNARLGVFGESPKQTAHEGNRLRVIRGDGSIDDSEFKASSAEMSIEIGEVPQLTIEARLAKINLVADELASQISRHAFDSLKEVLDKSGQVADSKGKPFNAEIFFQVLEKIHLEFDEYGKHNTLSLVMSPSLSAQAEQVLKEIDLDPKLRKRHEEIIERKRIEWRDREASRKLVG